jgi:gliding motility-associated-like protein
VQIGVPPKPGLVYRWTPSTGLTDPNISNPHASPQVTTTYVLRVNHDGGGCVSTDTVVVQASVLDTALQLLGKEAYCLDRGDSAVLRVQPTDSIQWYRDDVLIAGANKPRFAVTQSGTYYAELMNRMGCMVTTVRKQILVASVPVASIASPSTSQCLVGNSFNFSNTSSNAVGAMQFNWAFGDGVTGATRDAVHVYSQAGVYNVKLVVSSIPVCRDSVEFVVRVLQNAVADFSLKTTCINLPMQAINNTVDTMDSRVHYLWNFGNGQTFTDRIPPAQVYSTGGNYPVSLSVYTDQCPTPVNTLTKTLLIEKPRAALNYPVQYAVIEYPLTLQARNFGETVLWSPGNFLNNTSSFSPVFFGPTEQTYTIKITTASGCVTVDTQTVKTVKEAQIYVPSAFSPNDDGLNDFLRPIFMGIKEVHYFRVYNRWGQLLYERKSDLPGWDGKIAGVPQPTQVVVWMIEGVSVDNRVITRKGTTTLVR